METKEAETVRIVAYHKNEYRREKARMQEKEVFLNGFCRCQNQGRIVLCVYVNDGKKWQIDEIDCGYQTCPHSDSCEIARAVREGLKGE